VWGLREGERKCRYTKIVLAPPSPTLMAATDATLTDIYCTSQILNTA
jgi:hypothetical protein